MELSEEKVKELLDRLNVLSDTALSDLAKEYKAYAELSEKALRKRGNETMPVPKYKLLGVKKHEAGMMYSPAAANFTDCYTFTFELVNEEAKTKHINLFGFVNGSWDKRRQSVVYYFANGTIQHEGGGYIVFGKGFGTVPATKEEWDQIVGGKFPDSLRPDWVVD